MKTKLVAIQFDRHLTREDFAMTLQTGDQTPVRSNQATFHLPLPNLRLTDEELTQLRGRQPTKKNKHKGYSVRVRDPNAAKKAAEPSSAADSQNEEAQLLGLEMESGAEDSGSGDDDDESGDDEDGDVPTRSSRDVDLDGDTIYG
jgi:general transcription factor 3C polypeptide 5 (transcription factor C subunit 1)